MEHSHSSNEIKTTPRFARSSFAISSKSGKDLIAEILDKKEEQKEQKVNYKYVIVNDLKDTDNYFKFINNSKGFLDKIHKDRQWFESNKGYKALKSAQAKINKYISFSFDHAFHEMEENK